MTNIQGLDLDLLGVILSLLIPVIAYQVARHYSQHKRKNIEKILNEMDLIDNLLDLSAYFESSTSEAVIGGEINQAQMDFLREKFEKRKKEISKEKKKKMPSSPPRIANSSTVENGFEWTEFRKVKWFRKVGDTKWEKYEAAQKMSLTEDELTDV